MAIVSCAATVLAGGQRGAECAVDRGVDARGIGRQEHQRRADVVIHRPGEDHDRGHEGERRHGRRVGPAELAAAERIAGELEPRC